MHNPENLEYQKVIARESYGVHFNNRLTRDFTLEKGTLAHHILASNCLYCEQLDADNIKIMTRWHLKEGVIFELTLSSFDDFIKNITEAGQSVKRPLSQI